MLTAKAFSEAATILSEYRDGHIGVARGAKGPLPPKILENIVILCCERRFSKQNNVKSNVLARLKYLGHAPQIFSWPPQFFSLFPVEVRLS